MARIGSDCIAATLVCEKVIVWKICFIGLAYPIRGFSLEKEDAIWLNWHRLGRQSILKAIDSVGVRRKLTGMSWKPVEFLVGGRFIGPSWIALSYEL